MGNLSIFVDESGDFGPFDKHSPYYLFSLVIHEQDTLIEKEIDILNKKINEHGFNNHAIHFGPIIRNEGYYKRFDFNDRKRLFNDLLFFTKSVNVKYHIVCIDKKECVDKRMLTEKLSKQLALFIRDKYDYFNSFDEIIVYYDYGQSEITTILTSVFNSFFFNVEFRHVQPNQYKLFQVADLICTLELSKIKYEIGSVTQSEDNFYGGRRRFRDFYYKSIKNKKV